MPSIAEQDMCIALNEESQVHVHYDNASKIELRSDRISK